LAPRLSRSGCHGVGSQGVQPFSRIETGRHEAVRPSKGQQPSEDREGIGNHLLREPDRSLTLGPPEIGGTQLRHSDVPEGVAVGAGELAVTPLSSGRGQTDLSLFSPLLQRELPPPLDPPASLLTPLASPRDGVPPAHESQKPLVHHEVGDVADEGGLRAEPRDHI
jgi:hypothetical protein